MAAITQGEQGDLMAGDPDVLKQKEKAINPGSNNSQIPSANLFCVLLDTEGYLSFWLV